MITHNSVHGGVLYLIIISSARSNTQTYWHVHDFQTNYIPHTYRYYGDWCVVQGHRIGELNLNPKRNLYLSTRHQSQQCSQSNSKGTAWPGQSPDLNSSAICEWFWSQSVGPLGNWRRFTKPKPKWTTMQQKAKPSTSKTSQKLSLPTVKQESTSFLLIDRSDIFVLFIFVYQVKSCFHSLNKNCLRTKPTRTNGYR